MNNRIRIALVSGMMPTPTNMSGPSALPFQLISHRPPNIDLDIFTLNSNRIPDNLIAKYEEMMHCTVKVVVPNKLFLVCKKSRIFQYAVASLKGMPIESTIKLNRKLREHINSQYDYAWIYPHYLIGIASQLTLPTIVTGPDSSALDHFRCMKDEGSLKLMGEIRIKRYERWALNLESNWAKKKNVILHFVGREDCSYYLKRNPNGKGFYLTHPSNMHNGIAQREYSPNNNPIDIIIAGHLDRTTKTDSDVIISLLCKYSETLNKKYELTFLGKGWEEKTNMLHQKGYKVQQKKWVNDYFEELRQHDIQLFPISTGVGTKGKVLDALCAGIVCVGSDYAFENINLKDGFSAFYYKNPNTISQLLIYIYDNRSKLSEIASNGHQLVVREHSQAKIAEEFFGKFNHI